MISKCAQPVQTRAISDPVKVLTKYERPKMKRYAWQKCSLSIFSRSYFVRALNKKSQLQNFIRTTLDLQGSNRLQTLDQLLGLFLDCKSIKSSGWLQPKLDKNLVNSKRVWLPCILYNANFANFWKRIFSSLLFLFFLLENT